MFLEFIVVQTRLIGGDFIALVHTSVFLSVGNPCARGMSENRRTPQDTPQDTAVNEIKHYYKIKNRTSADKDIKISYD